MVWSGLYPAKRQQAPGSHNVKNDSGYVLCPSRSSPQPGLYPSYMSLTLMLAYIAVWSILYVSSLIIYFNSHWFKHSFPLMMSEATFWLHSLILTQVTWIMIYLYEDFFVHLTTAQCAVLACSIKVWSNLHNSLWNCTFENHFRIYIQCHFIGIIQKIFLTCKISWKVYGHQHTVF